MTENNLYTICATHFHYDMLRRLWIADALNQYACRLTLAAIRVHPNMTKSQYHQGHGAKRRKTAAKPVEDGSHEQILLADVKSLLGRIHAQKTREALSPEDHARNGQTNPLPERFSEIQVDISELSSTGDGLGLSAKSDHIYAVPFTVPGDVVQVKVITHFPEAQYSLTDLINVVTPGPQRDDTLPRCPYFAKCAGCQIQMLPYDAQLKHKQSIVEKAYQNFSGLTQDVIPKVGETIESPLQYGYRTKLTPHFDGPPGSMTRKAKRDPSERKGFETVPPIGFQLKGTRKTIDIEDCPIGTDAVRGGMAKEREQISKNIASFTRGATILLRESTLRKPVAASFSVEKPSNTAAEEGVSSPIALNREEVCSEALSKVNSNNDVALTYTEEKTCITDQRDISTEYVDDFVFRNTAGAFFQNNNSILPKFTAYIRDHVMPSGEFNNESPIKYLIDAYCGSGLFTVTLSSLFSSSMGIDIAGASIVSARENAIANNISNANFMTADASELFKEVTFPAQKTAVIIDPPRKGCDHAFLTQLLRFGPRRVVYVSCNVHTQARDVGILTEGKGDCRYKIESLQGFDFFPQTGHVEGVAILARITDTPS